VDEESFQGLLLRHRGRTGLTQRQLAERMGAHIVVSNSDDARPKRERRGCSSRGYPELTEYRAEVVLDGLFTDHERAGDLAV
jgi:hypothetical protein